MRKRGKFILSFFYFSWFLRKEIDKINFTNYKSEKSYLIVVSPWGLTTTPWFSIAVGLGLYKRKNKVHFLIDDLQFENIIDHKLQVYLIRISLFFKNKAGIGVKRLSSFKSSKILLAEDFEEINKLAFANAVHKNRGEEDTAFFNDLINHYKSKFEINYSTIGRFISENSETNFLIQGGIYGNSGLFVSILKNINLSFFTFDSGFGVLMSSYKGIASQLSDIPTSLELLSRNVQEIEYATNIAKDEMQKRRDGTNKLNSQYLSFDDSLNFEDVGILIPLNSPWDSAALCIATIFSTYNAWLIESIGIVLNSTNYNITIRQHPDERHWWGRTLTDFRSLINDEFGDNSRIQFVSCYDKVNTYALLEGAKAVICYSSTFGIESVIAKKPVCVCSSVYYSKLGFVFVPGSKNDLQLFLKSINLKNYSKEQLDNAFVTYYLGQQCNWLFSNFAPNYDDFLKWVRCDLQYILDDGVTNNYFESLETFLPLSYVNHLKSYNSFYSK